MIQENNEEWEKERTKAIKEFYREYEPIRKKYNLRMQSHTSLFDEGFIKIWRYEGEEKKELILTCKEEDDVELYKRATSNLISFKKIMEESKNG